MNLRAIASVVLIVAIAAPIPALADNSFDVRSQTSVALPAQIIDGLAGFLRALGDFLSHHTDAVPQQVAAGGFTPYAGSGRIDSLGNVAITNATVNGLSGLSDADIPDNITASAYLPLAGGTVTGNLVVNGSFSGSSISFSGASTTNSTSTNLYATMAAIDSLRLGNSNGVLKAAEGSVSAGLINLTGDVTGVLPVTNGGTGWASIRSGAVPFGNGTGSLATSSNLFWDLFNSRLGIGTSSPTASLSVAGYVSVGNASPVTGMDLNIAYSAGSPQVRIASESGTGFPTLYFDSYKTDARNGQPQFAMRNWGGSVSSPTALASGANLGEWLWEAGFDTSGNDFQVAAIQAKTDEATTPTHMGSHIEFLTAPLGGVHTAFRHLSGCALPPTGRSVSIPKRRDTSLIQEALLGLVPALLPVQASTIWTLISGCITAPKSDQSVTQSS